MIFIDSSSCFKRGLKQNADSPPGRKYIPAYSSHTVDSINIINPNSNILINKELFMDKEHTPNGEPATISFAGKMLTVNEPEPGKVITFRLRSTSPSTISQEDSDTRSRKQLSPRSISRPSWPA